jgi:DNA-binding PadR family transcriptional regulator
MKILAIIHHNAEKGDTSYGYGIWRDLKRYFHIYLNDGDIRNVYRHLKELCAMEVVRRIDNPGSHRRHYYDLTERGLMLRPRYEKYLDIVRHKASITS